jgi:hypothetical protein
LLGPSDLRGREWSVFLGRGRDNSPPLIDD